MDTGIDMDWIVQLLCHIVVSKCLSDSHCSGYQLALVSESERHLMGSQQVQSTDKVKQSGNWFQVIGKGQRGDTSSSIMRPMGR